MIRHSVELINLVWKALNWLRRVLISLGSKKWKFVVQPEDRNVSLAKSVLSVASLERVKLAPLELDHLLDDVLRSKTVSRCEHPLIVLGLVVVLLIIIGHTCNNTCVIISLISKIVFFYFFVFVGNFLSRLSFIVRVAAFCRSIVVLVLVLVLVLQILIIFVWVAHCVQTVNSVEAPILYS